MSQKSIPSDLIRLMTLSTQIALTSNPIQPWSSLTEVAPASSASVTMKALSHTAPVTLSDRRLPLLLSLSEVAFAPPPRKSLINMYVSL